MGKKKQAQRTKNNVVPASSGRSAELLQSSSGVPFVGFSTLKEGGFIPILSGISDELDTNINEDFRLVWKKMNKKDSTTKLKALDEFKRLCREVEVEALKPVLPFWPRLFCALSTDEEHRVREAAQAAHRAVVCKAGRNIAPYLKQLVGPWFTGQHDTYAPAASMAESAFQEAFTPNKLIEAIVFCQEEILNYITNNLLNQTAQSLANNPNASQEVKDARYQRVVVSCLNGYALYLQRLPTEHLRKAEEANLKLVSAAKFWKFNKDPAPIVRAAWFTALVALCEKAPFLLSQETKHACMAVFTNIDDTDPVVARNVWQAALLLFTVCEDVWKHVSLQKQVLPKLWKVLSDGANGNASLVFPHLLPLLSKIPSAMVTDKAKLYAKFFENLRYGLKVRNVQISAIETNAVVTAFLECLRYLVNINSEDHKLCLSLFEEQVFPLIENVMSDSKLHLARPCIFSGLASLVNHWSKPCTPPAAPPTAPPPDLYLALTTLYWQRLAALCRLLLEAHVWDPITLASNCTAVEVLLSALKKTDTQPRKHFRVKFVSPRKSPEDEPEVSFPSAEDSSLSPLYREQCNQLVFNQLAVCFQLINSCGDNTRAVLVTHLGRVVEEYQSSQLLQRLLEVTQLSWTGLYSRYLAVWLRNDNLPLNDTLRLIFTLLQYVQDDKQVLAVFADLSGEDSYSASNEEYGPELEPLQEVRWQAVVECALRPEYQSASVRRWLASHGSVCHLASLLTREHASYNTVHNCLYNLRNNSWLTTESLCELICSLRQNLASHSVSEEIQTGSADLLQALLHNPANHPSLAKLPAEELRSLLYELFTGSLQELTQYPNSWPQCLAVLALQSETDLAVSAVCETCVDLLVAVVRTRPMDLVESQQLTSVLEQLILSAASSSVDSITSLATTVLSRLVAKVRSQAEAVWNLLGVAETVLGSLRNEALSCTQRKSNEKTDPLDNVPLNHYITSMIPFLIMVVKLQTASTSDEAEDSTTSEDQFPYAKLRTVLPAEDRWDWTQQGLQLHSICVSFKNHFANTKQYFLLKDKITFIIEECGLLSQLKVRDVLKHLFLSDCKEGESSLKSKDPLSRLQTEVLLRDLCILYDAHHIRKELIPLKSNSTIVKHYYFPNEVLEEISVSGQIDRTQLPIINTCCRRLVEMRSDSDAESGSTHIAILDRVFDQFLAEEKENRSLLGLSDEQLHSLAEVIEFTCHSVTHDSAHLTQSAWDACLVATAALAHSTRTTLYDWTSTQSTHDAAPQKQRPVPTTQQWPMSLLQEKKEVGEEDSLRLVLVRVLSAICRLFDAVSAHMAAVDPQDKAAATRCAEWTDVFLADSHSAISQAWFKIADVPCIYPARFLLVETLSSSVAGFVYFPHFVEGSNTLGALDSCCRLLQSSHTLVQLTAYQLMLKLIPAMVELDMKQCEKDNVALSCQHVDQTLLYTQSIIDVILSGLSFGDLCLVEPFTDSYCYTRCYLLLWSALLQLCAHACAQLRPLYTTWLKEGYLSVFMKTVFCLMPEAALHGEVQSQRISQLFSKPPLLDKGVWGSERLSSLSCWVYACSLRRLPAAVRQWWNEADHRVYALVEHVTAIYLSPDLCAEEMRAIQTQEKKFDNMTVHVHPTSKEVYAVYTVEESRMELVIELAHNHPLGLVKVRSGQSMVSTTQTRQWLMQITILLTHQNGSIWDALELWKHSLDKRFEGVEECYICFAILHSVSRQLPKLSCQTCRKKFHSHCLYKWFTTSNKSTCPICRNLF